MDSQMSKSATPPGNLTRRTKCRQGGALFRNRLCAAQAAKPTPGRRSAGNLRNVRVGSGQPVLGAEAAYSQVEILVVPCLWSL